MLRMSDIEKLYSPSKWSKRLPGEVICQKHVEFIKSESDKVRNAIPSELNIAYGDKPREKLDIFGIDLPNDAPVFIFIHGGYWQEEGITHDVQSFIAKNLHENGIKTVCVGYELCPQVTLDDLVKNIEKAIQHCLKIFSKSKNIHLAGHSAGAHLVLSLYRNLIKNLPLEQQKFFKTAFLLCGIYDLLPLLETSYNIPLQLDEETAKNQSLMFQKIEKTPTKFHVIAAENDSPAFVEQSEKIHEHLQQLKLQSTYQCIPIVDHFDIIENLVNPNFELTTYIIREIKNH